MIMVGPQDRNAVSSRGMLDLNDLTEAAESHLKILCACSIF